MTPFLNGMLPTRAPVPWKLSKLYNGMEFDSEILTRIKQVPGENKFLVLGLEGKVWLFDGLDLKPEPKLVLDISWKVPFKGSGLSGVAFHPKFTEVGNPHYREIFLYYSMGDEELSYHHAILAKYRFSPNLDSILETSEEILIQQYDRSYEHDGGALFFDNEGYLHLTIGDEGSPHTRKLENSQSIENKLFGGLIRIDVDMDENRSHPIRRQPLQHQDRDEGVPGTFTQNYYIPNDNPWIDNSGGHLEEFYAIGLRSPFTAFYDTIDNEIWIADVGDGKWEELSIITAGSNAMWPYFEGPEQQAEIEDDIIGDPTDPVHFYGRIQGNTIIGGFLYRGSKYPELNGSFIFGDFGSGNIWSFDEGSENPITLLTRGPGRIVAYFPCLDGGICMMRTNGEIYQLEENVIMETAPELLSDLGAFEGLESLSPSEGIMPYEINSPLWSDGSLKRRWISLPDTSRIVFNIDDPWEFPVGTVLIKHFEMPIDEDSIKRLETRFFVVDLDRNGYGLTYKWNETDTDAKLVAFDEVAHDTLEVLTSGEFTKQVWNYPTRTQCIQCHNDNANFVLGVKTAQMNRLNNSETGAINQIELWNELGFFSNENISAELPVLSNLKDTSFSIEHRIRSYLDANCSHCHQPYGVDTKFDARFKTPLWAQKIIGEEADSYNSEPGNLIVNPGDPETSEMWIRDSSIDDNKMPPIAKNKLDHEYLDLLRHWIEDMDPNSLDPVSEVIVIFPNPVRNGRFRIHTEHQLNEMGLYDLSGRLVPLEVIDHMGTLTEVRVEVLPGFYNLLLQVGDKIYIRKIIISD